MTAADALTGRSRVLDEAAMGRAIVRLAHEIAERHPGLERVVLAGVRTRGVPLAGRLRTTLARLGQPAPVLGVLELTDYRDDRPRPASPQGAALRTPDPAAVGISVDGCVVVVVDDVFYTGRTLRAAMDALARQGRPACVELLALVDRGHRELPVRATYVGKNIPTSPRERVAVRLRETDGVDGAWLEPQVVEGAGQSPAAGDGRRAAP